MHPITAEYLRWIVLLPLGGALLLGVTNRRLPAAVVSLIASLTVLGSFLLSVKAFFALKTLPAAERLLTDTVYQWIPVGDLRIDVSFMADSLTAVMILFVTGVAFLIHIYSIGYMRGDRGYQRYFAYLNLFVGMMLILVLADNLPLLFVGWEGVGLCSYLLIGFWFEDLANSAAGKKAFLVNRIGDFGFLLGMLLIARTLSGHVGGENLFSFRVMAEHTALLAPVATAIALLLFTGATGKSAQIPLFVWLPDAMAGPTPVSALIHAATMVTAGVYMVARMNFLYLLTPVAMAVVAVVGALTALVAATIAITQTDIKKVLAYSTVSQLGYMFLACGVGAFGAGIFHVMTHAFFKALLFMCAGSVIHALHHQQDMRHMGGLRDKMPVTFVTMFAATLAIAGVFPFAGFFSKDEILYNTFLSSKVLWVVGFAVAGLTAFYMMRLIALTFFGKSRVEAEHAHEVHESPATMTIPLVILGVLSLVGGWIGWPRFLGGSNRFEAWLQPVFEHGGEFASASHGLTESASASHSAMAAGAHGAVAAHAAVAEGAVSAHAAASTTEWILAAASLALAVVGLVAGFVIYTRRLDLADAGRQVAGGRIYWLLKGKYFVDEIYETLIVRPGYWLSDVVFFRFTDTGLIDGVLVNGTARTLGILGSVLRLLQNGMIRWYAYSFTLGVLVILFYLVRHL